MSLLFDVLKKQESVSAIPETEPPDAADLAEVQVNSPPRRTDSEMADSIALQLDESVAAAPAVEPSDSDDTTSWPGAGTLELEPEAASEETDRSARDKTMHERSDGAPTPGGSVSAAYEPTVGKSGPFTMWRRRPAVEWALIALFLVSIVVVTMVFFIESEPDAALAPADIVAFEPEPVAMTEPEVIADQPTEEPAAELLSKRAADIPADVPGDNTPRNDGRHRDRRAGGQNDASSSGSDGGQAIRSADGIKVTQTHAADPVFATLSLAYTAYQRGDDATAFTHYRIAAELDPNNRNALLGLAAVAQRRGDLAEARRLYQRLLGLDPKDSVAASAMLALREDRNAINDESWLKAMLREEPRAAHLHFGLGLGYAAQERWPDAQGSFFEAVRYAPENADYNFNLAVTLDRLGKQRSAATYYRRAIAYATGAQSFDVDLAKVRLKSISGGTDG